MLRKAGLARDSTFFFPQRNADDRHGQIGMPEIGRLLAKIEISAYGVDRGEFIGDQPRLGVNFLEVGADSRLFRNHRLGRSGDSKCLRDANVVFDRLRNTSPEV